MESNIIENAGNTAENFCEEAETKSSQGSKLFRGTLIAAITVSFIIFVYLLLYFCENTGA